MRLLTEISDKDFGINNNRDPRKPYRVRKSARAVLFNDKNEMALQYIGNYNGESFHKLPGGGVDKGETIEQALHREILEEVGCKIKIGDPIGIIFEAREQHDLFHISFCYIAYVEGAIGEPKLEDCEIEEETSTRWLPLDDSIELAEKDKYTEYEIKFMHKRDLIFIKEAKKILKK